MAKFLYEAVNAAGQEIKAEIDAASADDAVSKIRSKGYFPTKIKGIRPSEPTQFENGMMWMMPDRCGVETDLGFKVDHIGSFTSFIVRYHEGPRLLHYELDDGSPDIKVEIIRHWNPPFEQEDLPFEKRVQIAERICAAMQFWGDKARVGK